MAATEVIDESVATNSSNSPQNGESGDARRGLAELSRAIRPAIALPAICGVALFALAWQLVALHTTEVIPTIPQVFDALRQQPKLYALKAVGTLRETAVGFCAGFGAAFVLAVLMIYSRLVERIVMPLAVILSVTPIIALSTGLTVAFGFGFNPKYIIAALVVFFPLLINSLIGLRSIDPAANDFLQTIHGSRTEILLKLRLPSSLPYLFAAFRISVPLSLTGAVVAEFLASGQPTGLGSLMANALPVDDLSEIYASAVILATIGLVLTLAVVVLERSVLSWHPSRRAQL